MQPTLFCLRIHQQNAGLGSVAMWNDYLTYLDYLELRRRVERRLGSHNLLLGHSIAFVIATLVLMTRYLSLLGYSPYFIDPNVSIAIGGWSLALLIHAAIVYRRSGVFSGARERAIEAEMRARIKTDEHYLNDEPREMFRLHGLLDEDIRQRAGLHKPLFSFVILNMLIWALHIAIGPGSLVAWHGTLLLLIGMVAFLILAARDRYLHGQWMQRQITSAGGMIPKSKNQRQYRSEEPTAEDEELMNLDEYLEKVKRSG